MKMSEVGLVHSTEGGLKALKTPDVTTNKKYWIPQQKSTDCKVKGYWWPAAQGLMFA